MGGDFTEPGCEMGVKSVETLLLRVVSSNPNQARIPSISSWETKF